MFTILMTKESKNDIAKLLLFYWAFDNPNIAAKLPPRTITAMKNVKNLLINNYLVETPTFIHITS